MTNEKLSEKKCIENDCDDNSSTVICLYHMGKSKSFLSIRIVSNDIDYIFCTAKSFG